jgi:hypothetical protein
MIGKREPWGRHEILRVAALVAGTLWIWWAHIIGTAEEPFGFGVGDLDYFVSAYAFEASRLRAGALPLWNPWQGAGLPFLASLQPGALYPARLLLLVLNPATAAGASVLAHLLLAVVATDRLCRRLGASGSAAAMGGMVFGAVYALPTFASPPQLEPSAWLPVIGILLLDVVEGRRGPAPLALALAMPLLAGGYQVGLYIAYWTVLFTIAVAVDRRWRGQVMSRDVLGRLTVAGALGLLTAAPQVWPTVAWSTQAFRNPGGLTDDMILPGSSYPGIASLFHAQALRGLVWGTDQPMQFAHLSIPVIVLALVGCLGSGAFGVVLGLSTLLGVGLMLGPGTPWSAMLRLLPGIALFRFPTRAFVVVAFGAAVLCALGAGRLMSLARPVALRGMTAAALLILVFFVVVWPQRNVYQLPWTAPRAPQKTPAYLDRLPALIGNGRASVPGGRLDLKLGFYPRQGTARAFRVLEDYEPLSSRRLLDFLTAVAGDYRSPSAPYLPFTGSLLDAKEIVRPQLLDLVAVRAVVTPLAVASPGLTRWKLLERTGDLGLFENRAALPRAYVVERARFVPDEAAALAAIVQPTFAGREEVVLLGAPEDESDGALAGASPRPLTEAHIVRDDPERVVVDVAPQRAGVLVVADAFAPGWVATFYGKSRRIWQANYMVRGVVVRPGDQLVELTYHPPGFRPAMTAAVAAWTLFLAAVIWQRRRRADSASSCRESTGQLARFERASRAQ